VITALTFCVWIVLLLIDHVCFDEDAFVAAVQRCVLMNHYYVTGRGSQFDD